MSEEIDFDFETGEIVETPQFDVVDFHAHVEGYWGRACVTNRVKIRRKVPSVGQLSIRLDKEPFKTSFFRAVPHWYTRRPWKPHEEIPYIHESTT